MKGPICAIKMISKFLWTLKIWWSFSGQYRIREIWGLLVAVFIGIGILASAVKLWGLLLNIPFMGGSR